MHLFNLTMLLCNKPTSVSSHYFYTEFRISSSRNALRFRSIRFRGAHIQHCGLHVFLFSKHCYSISRHLIIYTWNSYLGAAPNILFRGNYSCRSGYNETVSLQGQISTFQYFLVFFIYLKALPIFGLFNTVYLKFDLAQKLFLLEPH
jgi:hypothetical protein